MKAKPWMILVAAACLAAGSWTLVGEEKKAPESKPAEKDKPDGKPKGKPREIKVLWIGASSTTRKLFKVTEAMVQESGTFQMTSTRAGNSTYMQKIAEGGYDFVVLQVCRNLLDSAEARAVAWETSICKSIIKKGGVPILYEHYMRTDKQLKNDQDRLSDICRKVAAKSGARYSATGQAFKAVAAEKGVDYVLNVSVGDRGHAGHNGNYLFACGISAALTGQSPVGSKVREVDSAKPDPKEPKNKKKRIKIVHKVPDDEAALMQKIAWEQYEKGIKDIQALRKPGGKKPVEKPKPAPKPKTPPAKTPKASKTSSD